MTTTASIETLSAAVATKRVALDAALAAATQWTGQGAVAFARAELGTAERALAAAQPAAVAQAQADAAGRAEHEAFKAAQIAERVAARVETTAPATFRPAARTARRARCTCGHCMACIGE